MKRVLIRSSLFARDLRQHFKKHPQDSDRVLKVLEILSADAFDSRIKTHKLTGNPTGKTLSIGEA